MGNKIPEETVKTDVLILGGGIAGLMAAINAKETAPELRVIVVDKANTKRSGSAGMGNDHTTLYLPDKGFGDKSIEKQLAGFGRTPPYKDAKIQRLVLENSYDTVKRWDRWGIPMTYKGQYWDGGHQKPMNPDMKGTFCYNGQDQKLVLTQQAVNRGVEIMNRINATDCLVHDGRVIGAIGFSARDPVKAYIFHAKSVLLATGYLTRLWPHVVTGWLFAVDMSPNTTGCGRAMAYRAGAELTNMALHRRRKGMKYFINAGQGSWIGIKRDGYDRPVTPWKTTIDKYSDTWEDFPSKRKEGTGPVWVDCRGASDELITDMRHWTTMEANEAFWDYMDKEGIDIKEHPIEFTDFALLADHGGTVISDKCETTIPGLFAVQGGNVLITMGAASNLGWVAGEAMAKYAKDATPSRLNDLRHQIEQKIKQAENILNRETGAEWMEANIAVQCVMRDYCGEVRSEPLLDTGLMHLNRVINKTHETMKADNAHELMRCYEVLNLLDLGKLVLSCALERKETRGGHRQGIAGSTRADYPDPDPHMDKYLIVKQSDTTPVYDWEETGNAWTRPRWE